MQVCILFVGRSIPPATLVGTQWPQALWAIYVGLAGAMLGLVLGQHTALGLGALLQSRDLQRRHKAVPPAEGATTAAAPARLREPLTLATISPPPRPGTPEAEADPAAAEVAATGSFRGGGADAGAVMVQVDGAKPDGGVDASPEAAQNGAPTLSRRKPSLLPSGSLACHLADAASLASLLTLTGVSAAYAYLDRNPPEDDDRRYWWLAILFGPAGCVLRWYLSRFNPVPAAWRCGCWGCGKADLGGGEGLAPASGPGPWAWLHLGTFAANTLGCVLDFLCEALLFRLGGSLTSTQHVALQGLMVGTAGCLSTVSTWVVELQKLAISSPLDAYYYFSFSSLVAIALGLIIYGIPAWTAPMP